MVKPNDRTGSGEDEDNEEDTQQTEDDVEEDSEEQPTPELNDNVRRTVRCTDPYRLFQPFDVSMVLFAILVILSMMMLAPINRGNTPEALIEMRNDVNDIHHDRHEVMNNNIVGDPVGHDENLRWNHDQYQLSQEATDNDTYAPNHDIAAAIPDDNDIHFSPTAQPYEDTEVEEDFDSVDSSSIIVEPGSDMDGEHFELDINLNLNGENERSLLLTADNGINNVNNHIDDDSDDDEDRSSIITHITDNWSEGSEEISSDEEFSSKDKVDSSIDENRNAITNRLIITETNNDITTAAEHTEIISSMDASTTSNGGLSEAAPASEPSDYRGRILVALDSSRYKVTTALNSQEPETDEQVDAVETSPADDNQNGPTIVNNEDIPSTDVPNNVQENAPAEVLPMPSQGASFNPGAQMEAVSSEKNEQAEHSTRSTNSKLPEQLNGERREEAQINNL